MTTLESSPAKQASDDRPCPFVGLLAYSEADEDWFFGRESDARLIASNLTAYELTVLYGPSGVGKTSVVRAGVLPALRRAAEHQRQVLERTPAVTVIHRRWHSDPLHALVESISDAIAVQTGSLPVPIGDDARLVERLRTWSRQLGAQFLIILDQFEEYLLYHPSPTDPVTEELAEAIAERDDDTNFLISIRDDALAQLDRFDGLVPGLFDNTYRIEPLNRASARRAIIGPLERFNSLHPDQAVEIEDALIDKVLGSVRITRPTPDHPLDQPEPVDAVEASELQLVFERLWRETVAGGGRALTLATLERLGGAEDVIRSHLVERLAALDDRQQALAAEAFSQLVTPSGSKIAHSVDDLASYANVPRAEMLDVLERLSEGGCYVLRPVAGMGDDEAPRYEIYHDVLGPPIAEWTTQRRATQLARARSAARRKRRRRIIAAVAFLVVVAVTAVVAVLALHRMVNDRHRDFSVERSQAALNALEVDPARAAELALEAYERAQTEEAQAALRTALSELDLRVVLAGHTAALTAGALSTEGTTVVTASLDGTARLWDADTGTTTQTLEGHVGPVTAAAFATNDENVVTAGEDGSIRVWSIDEGTQPFELATEIPQPSIVVSADGQTLAAFGESAAVEIWDVDDGTLIHSLDHVDAERVDAVTFGSHDGRDILVTGDDLGTLRVWDVARGSEQSRRDGLNPISSLDVASDGSWIVIGSWDMYPYVWDWVADGDGSGTDDLVTLVHEHRNPYGVASVSVSPDGEHLVTSGDRGAALWPKPTIDNAFARAPGERNAFFPTVLDGHTGFIIDVAWSPDDGELLATAETDGPIRIWDGATGNFLNELDGHQGMVSQLEFRSDGALLSVGDDRTARLWSTSDDLVFRGHWSWANDVALHEESGLLVSAGADGLVVGSDASTGAPRWTIESDGTGTGLGFLTTVAVSADGRHVAVGGTAWQVHVWDIAGATPVHVASWRTPAMISDVSFDPTGDRLAVGVGNGAVHLWRWDDPEAPIDSLLGHEGMTQVAFGAGGIMLVTGGGDGSLRIWDAQTEALVKELSGHDGGTRAVAFLPDGEHIVSGGWDRTLRITHVETGKRRDLLAHEHPIVAVDVEDTSGHLVAGDAAGFVSIWRWDGGDADLLSMRDKHELYVNGLEVSDGVELAGQDERNDGELAIFSAGDDNVVRGYGCETCAPLEDLAAAVSARLDLLPGAAAAAATTLALGPEIPVGACADNPGGEEWLRLEPIDCATPHDLEFFGSFQLPDPSDAPYVEDVIMDRALAGCVERAEARFGSWSESVEVTTFQATAGAWEDGARHVQCAFRNVDGSKLVGLVGLVVGED